MKWIAAILSLCMMNAYGAAILCPAVSKIQDVGLSDNLVKDNDGKWYAGRISQNYGTANLWTFVIGGISAPNKEKAVTFANLALSSLSYSSGPSKAPGGKYLCVYNNDFDYLSGAVTPPLNRLSEYKIK